MKSTILLTLLLTLPLFAADDQTQQEDTLEYKLPTVIVVTAPRMSVPIRELPFSASVVDNNTIRELPRSFSVDEALRLVPGVKVDNQSNGSRVHLSIRGQGILTERGIRGIKILYDGIPVNDPTGFAPDFFDVDFNTVDRIEVLRGAAASLYGGSASGGIVNIISRNAPPEPLYGEASMSYGSNNFWKSFGQFGGYVNNVNYRLSFSRAMGDGYRQHTRFWGDNIYGKAVYVPSKSVLVTPIVGWTKVYHENPEGIDLATYNLDPTLANPDAIPYNEFLQTERVTNGVTGLVAINDHHQIQYNGYIKRTLFTEANNHTFNHRKFLTSGTSIQYLSDWKLTKSTRNKVSVGTDLEWQTIDEHRNDNIYGAEGDTLRSKEQIKQRGVGLFLIDKVEIGEQWGVMLSLRYDDIHNELNDLLKLGYDASGSADFSKTTGRVGVTFTPTEKLNLFANWGQGFLPPATEELAQNPDNFGGFNKHLTSATSNGVDLGARGALLSNWYYDLTGFYLSTQNDFDRYRITDPLRNQETFYRNAGASKRFGLEFYSRYLPIPALEIQTAYTYSHFKYDLSSPIQVLMDDSTIVKYIQDGNWLPNSPQHQLAVDVEYRILPNLTIGMMTETVSKTYIDGADIESEAAPGYTLISALVRYGWQLAGLHGEIDLNGRNLGDKKYVAFTEPDPGGNAYQPGAGREFFAALRVQL